MYPPASLDLARKRRDVAPLIQDAFHAFSQLVFADGALPAKTKQLIAVAAAHITQCPYCIQSHTKAALKHGATQRKSWRRSGSPPRCEPVVPTRIRQYRSPRSTRSSNATNPEAVAWAAWIYVLNQTQTQERSMLDSNSAKAK